MAIVYVECGHKYKELTKNPVNVSEFIIKEIKYAHVSVFVFTFFIK